MTVSSRPSDEPNGSTIATPATPAPQVELRGTVRECLTGTRGTHRVRPGDIAVVDAPDMTRRAAEQLIAAQPSAVINLSRFSTGAIPNYGPHMLLDAGIALFEDAGAELRAVLRDGKKGAVVFTGATTAEVTQGKKLLGQVRVVQRRDVDASFATAQQSLLDHMEAYFGNTIEFIHSEVPLLIDGVGVPELGSTMVGRKVVIVEPSDDSEVVRGKVERLRNFIREYAPVIIGVGSAADTLADLGYDPDFIVGDPLNVSAETLRGGARVILPADPDGHAAGLERIQDLGVGAMTFPAATDSPTDLAILLATVHEAETIVTVGEPLDAESVFARAPHATPAALLTRLKAGSRLVDSTAIESLYAVAPRNGLAWAWAILGLLVTLATVILVAGLNGPGTFADNLAATFNAVADTVRGWVAPQAG
ncbi:putative cytokinetic ring protein SteA [Corynebacterium sp.]|uniref:putative cytokinetic ring protein SteA n=1 Tax=Corynebacterium sp. TaxID=1720 RepID=UPI002A90EBB5|nr:putative cytokinetic ring protein SteA [Corynebacterium sp.]MDY5785790.1 putative cytokinetic ring protein SteA [Corynebacterium sp.]